MSVLRARHRISIEKFPYAQYMVESLSFDLNVQFLCETLCECTACYRSRVLWENERDHHVLSKSNWYHVRSLRRVRVLLSVNGLLL